MLCKLVRKTYDNLIWLFSALTGPADLTGFVCSGVASAPLSEDAFPSLTAEEPVRSRERRSVPVSVRWDPRPGCYPALIKMPRRSFRHVVATGG